MLVISHTAYPDMVNKYRFSRMIVTGRWIPQHCILVAVLILNYFTRLAAPNTLI